MIVHVPDSDLIDIFIDNITEAMPVVRVPSVERIEP